MFLNFTFFITIMVLGFKYCSDRATAVGSSREDRCQCSSSSSDTVNDDKLLCVVRRWAVCESDRRVRRRWCVAERAHCVEFRNAPSEAHNQECRCEEVTRIIPVATRSRNRCRYVESLYESQQDYIETTQTRRSNTLVKLLFKKQFLFCLMLFSLKRYDLLSNKPLKSEDWTKFTKINFKKWHIWIY